MKLLLFLWLCTILCITQPKTWTILTYIAADNDLNKYAALNTQQMLRAGSNDDRTILVYLAETKDNKKYGKLLRIDSNAIVELACDNDVDSGAQVTCLNACTRAFSAYPAQHYALIFWDHGAGCLNLTFSELFKSIAYDEPMNSYLSDTDLFIILQKLSQNVLGGKKIDIVGFDACLMASLELQTICAPYVDYYVASEELESGPGWNYTAALNPITDKSTPIEVAQTWVTAFEQTYTAPTDLCTLSAVCLVNIHLLATYVDEIAKIFMQLLDSVDSSTISSLLQHATQADRITCFDNPAHYDYVDLDHLFANILEEIIPYKSDNAVTNTLMQQAITLLTQGRALIPTLVIAKTAGNNHARAQGISMYWAQKMVHPTYSSLAWTYAYPNWEALLQKYTMGL